MVRPDRFELAILPTPLRRARGLERALGSTPIWVKHDELIGFAVAGNKARPLEYLLGDAVARSADVLVVTGSPHSNFCAAAAVAARVAGLDCDVLYSGAQPAHAPTNVQLARVAGATVRFDETLARGDLDAAIYRHARRLRAQGRHPYPIPRGGASAVGAVGFATAASELAMQCADAGVGPCTVVLPAGSGGSQAGLVAGCVAGGFTMRIVGASVSRPAEAMQTHVLELARECAALLGSIAPTAADVDVRDAIGQGFGVADEPDHISARIALEGAGLLLDDTYTAKAMTLLRGLAGENRGPLVFWHTGGLAGALAELEEGPQ